MSWKLAMPATDARRFRVGQRVYIPQRTRWQRFKARLKGLFGPRLVVTAVDRERGIITVEHK